VQIWCRVPVIHQLHRGVAVIESKASFYQDPVLRVVVQNLEKTRHIQRRYSEPKNYCFGFFLKDKKRKKWSNKGGREIKNKKEEKSSYEKGEGEKKVKYGKVRKMTNINIKNNIFHYFVRYLNFEVIIAALKHCIQLICPVCDLDGENVSQTT
jgi:hypothetical protein